MADQFQMEDDAIDDANIAPTTDGDPESKIPVIKRVLKDGITSPVCVIVVGMAGSGKTTFMSQLYRSLQPYQEENNDENEEKDITTSVENLEIEEKPKGYFLNLDPATKHVPFGASIDIRDTVDYKEVMKQHNLGPNGAIMTSLNLFSTKFDQVISILEERAFHNTAPNEESTPNLNYILVDTPGQIEAFTWSASGSIFTQGLASSFPTVLAFVVDTPRCAASPHTFMSNMLYACSMLYRTHLPIVIVFNKSDVVPIEFALQWMRDFESFQAALDESANSSYYTSLTRSLSLVLDEFYHDLNVCGVSSITGDGLNEFWNVVNKAASDFVTDYLPDLKDRIMEQDVKKKAIMRMQMKKLKKDMQDHEGNN